MKGKKILITGASGMLGQRVAAKFTALPGYDVFTVGRNPGGLQHFECDISDITAFSKLLADLIPDVVIHCAANVNLDSCEKNKAYTYQLHVLAARAIASSPHVGKSIFISTDSVFNGQTGGYNETDPVDPLNYYALTKCIAEEAFLNARHPAIVLRTNIVGFKNPGGGSLFEWAFNSLTTNTPISGFSNVCFNPLYVGTLAGILTELVEENHTGLFHIGSRNVLSKYDFIINVADFAGLPRQLIQEATYNAEGQHIKRPQNSTLDVSHFVKTTGIALPDLGDEIQALLKDYQYSHQV